MKQGSEKILRRNFSVMTPINKAGKKITNSSSFAENLKHLIRRHELKPAGFLTIE